MGCTLKNIPSSEKENNEVSEDLRIIMESAAKDLEKSRPETMDELQDRATQVTSKVIASIQELIDREVDPHKLKVYKKSMDEVTMYLKDGCDIIRR